MLRFGSTGSEVARLQAALNLDTTGPTLKLDGLFGLRTHRRVTTFQASRGAHADGIVGPITMTFLKPLFDLLDHAGKRVVPNREEALRDQIVKQALAHEAAWGWNHPANSPPAESHRISLRRMVDTVTRARHGGLSLLVIMLGGGAPPQYTLRAPTIPAGMAQGELDKGDLENDAILYSQQRNNKDILSWCGVFALYVLRRAGITVQGWAESGGLTSQVATDKDSPDTNRPLRLISPSEVRRGDIGVMSPAGRNHHFIVVERNGSELKTVDGNAGGHHSIVKQTYTLQLPNSTNAKDLPMVSRNGKLEPCALLSAFPQGAPGGPDAALGFEKAGNV